MSLVRERTDRSRNRSRRPNLREGTIVPVRERKKSKIVPVNRFVPVWVILVTSFFMGLPMT